MIGDDKLKWGYTRRRFCGSYCSTRVRFPPSPLGVIAQLGERLNGIQEAEGSSPSDSTVYEPDTGLAGPDCESGICEFDSRRAPWGLCHQRYLRRYQMATPQEERQCNRHGLVKHKLLSGGAGRKKRWACIPCLRKRQLKAKLNKKLRLVKEAGGACVLCGYDECYASLEFHHLDPSAKEIQISVAIGRKGIEACRKEVEKCILVCSNCHGEIEAKHGPTLQKLDKHLAP